MTKEVACVRQLSEIGDTAYPSSRWSNSPLDLGIVKMPSAVRQRRRNQVFYTYLPVSEAVFCFLKNLR